MVKEKKTAKRGELFLIQPYKCSTGYRLCIAVYNIDMFYMNRNMKPDTYGTKLIL